MMIESMNLYLRCNKCVVTKKKLKEIRPMGLSDPWSDSYLNDCKVSTFFFFQVYVIEHSSLMVEL